MTREEAFKNLVALNAVCGQKDFFDKEFEEALLVAEKALEQQPCDDVLDKIKAEIEEKIIPSTLGGIALKQDCLTIIDRHKLQGVEE